MRIWAVLAASLLVASVDGYVKNWATDADPAEALRRLEARAATCPSSTPNSCQAVDPKLPGNFCCDSDKKCLSVDKSSSALCCPKDSDCATIQIIDCNITLQADGPIWTTKLNDKLPTCGSQCCPFGYKCSNINGDFACTLVTEDAGPATTVTSTSKTSATVTTSPTAVGIDSNDPPPTKETNNFPAGVFFAGFFPGIIVGVLGTLAWVIYTKRNVKATNTRGLNMEGNGARPFISLPVKDNRQSNERSDFLGRTRSRARSMFSTHRHTRTMDSPDIWNTKMPTPPAVSNIPINYVNDMPDVPVTPRRRIARPASDDDLYRAPRIQDNHNLTPVTPGVGDLNRPETIRVYSPDLTQELKKSSMPQHPSAAVPPLRGMNTQRRISPEYGSIIPPPQRRDSGKGMDTFGSPFQTPEKKPVIFSNTTPSMHATYHDAATFESPVEPVPHMLTPARYDPNNNIAPSAAANLAASRLSKAQQSLPSQAKPTIPSRPARPAQRPETQYSEEFDFDAGIDNGDHSPVHQSPPRDAYKSQAVWNPYAEQSRANPASTFDNLVPTAPGSQFDSSRKNKHATNMTTFTTMLRNVGIPDSGDQLGVPAVPKLDMKKVKASNKNKNKGMI